MRPLSKCDLAGAYYTICSEQTVFLRLPNMARGPADPVRLRTILQHLRREPRPILPAVKYLKLTYAVRNDHFGARYVSVLAVSYCLCLGH